MSIHKKHYHCVIIYMCCCLSTLKVKTSCVAECVYIYAIPPGGPRPTLCCGKVWLRLFIGQKRHSKARKRYLVKFCTTKLLFLLHFITDKVSVNLGIGLIHVQIWTDSLKTDSGCIKPKQKNILVKLSVALTSYTISPL